MVFLGIIILCPIFIFIIFKSIFNVFESKKLKILISIIICVVDIFITLFLLDYMGFHYIGTIEVFVLLNLSIIILIYLFKFIKNSKYKRIFIIIIFSIIIILGIMYIYNNVNEESIEKEDFNKNFIVVNSNDIIKEFIENEVDANEKYKGNVLNIKGIIIEKYAPKDFKPLRDASCIVFGDDIDATTKIECYFDDIIVHDLEIGQEVIVKCKYIGYSEYDFGNYIIFKKGKIFK